MHAGQPIYEDLDNRNGQILAITNPGYNNNPNTSKLIHIHTSIEYTLHPCKLNLTHKQHNILMVSYLFFLVNGHNDNSVGIAEQDFMSHTYQEIGQFAHTFHLTYTAMHAHVYT